MEKSDQWIYFPNNDQEFEEAQRLWQTKYKFPYAIGALDCTLIPIRKPSLHGDEYICRKQFPALNVQATVNADSIFTSVDCSWAGSVHDARIWRNSEIQQAMARQTTGAVLLGDEGYGITPYLMTCYKNPVTAPEKAFNYLHKKERTIIECTFGQLKQRFPILYHKIRINIGRIPCLISSCFVLHNIAKYLKEEPFEPPDSQHDEQEPINDVVIGDLQRRGKTKRTAISELIVRL